MVPTFASPPIPANCLQVVVSCGGVFRLLGVFNAFSTYIFHYSFIPYSHPQGLSWCCVFCLYPVLLHNTSLPTSKHLFLTQVA